MNERLPMAQAEITEEDVQAVADVVRSKRLALGTQAPSFEEEIAARVGVAHAVAVSSGTAALHLIVRALGLGPSDEVLVPSFTFAASVNAIIFDGARPVFVDIEPETFNLDPEHARTRITDRTKAIMAVDVFGHPADWDGIETLAAEFDLRIIDDCCEALGATYKDRPLGSLGAAGAFAFYPNKQMTTGEGGMVVTDDDRIAEIARSLRNQGRGQMGQWLEHERLGYNYRMDEMSAALGRSQLRRLDTFLAQRDEVAQMYNRRLAEVAQVQPPVVKPDIGMSWFVYVIRLADGINRDAVMKQLAQKGIPSRAYFSPIHRQPYISRYVSDIPELPVTESAAASTLALPFYPAMTSADVELVVDELQSALSAQ